MEKAVNFYIPKLFDAGSLPDRIRPYAFFFLNLLHWKRISWQEDEQGFIHLKYDYLTKVIPRDYWREIKSMLIRDKVIRTDRKTAVGLKCLGFQICPRFQVTMRVECEDAKLTRKINKRLRTQSKQLLPVHRWLVSKFDSLSFDMKQARSIIRNLQPEENSALSSAEYQFVLTAYCEKLANREFGLTCDKYGRVHTLITSLPRELRCCLRVQGERLVNLDLRNSQPLIAGICARRFYLSKDTRYRCIRSRFADNGNPYCFKAINSAKPGSKIPEDVEEYIRLCEEGTFYESLMCYGEERSGFKKRMYKEVFFGKNQYCSALKSTFAQRFPHMAGMFSTLKKKDHRRSAWILQNLEATLFIYVICGRLMKSHPNLTVYTIHDSILTTPKHAELVKSVILDEFAKLGIRPQLHTERYNEKTR